MLNLPVILAVDRAGLVGEDGETHHGIYDVGFLRHAPGMRILCPASLDEVKDMLRWATVTKPGPIAIRYPRGGNGIYTDSAWNPNQSVCVHRMGKDLTIVTYGTLVNQAIAAADLLAEAGIEATVLRLLCVNPIAAEEMIPKLSPGKLVYVAEEVSGNCGIREYLSGMLKDMNKYVTGIDLGNRYIQHGSVAELYDYYGLSPKKLARSIMEVQNSEN